MKKGHNGMNFTGKVAISTGAASGMGLLFAENFAALGGNVVMCDVNEAALAEKVAAITPKTNNIEIIAGMPSCVATKANTSSPLSTTVPTSAR